LSTNCSFLFSISYGSINFPKRRNNQFTKKLRIKENEKPEIQRQTPRDRNRHACFTSVSPQHIERNNGKGAKKESSKGTERKKERKKERKNLPDVSTVVVVVILVRHSSKLRLQPHWKAQNDHDLLLLLQQQQQKEQERAIGPNPNPRSNDNRWRRVNDFTLV
jgi:hypothetical protein